MSTENLKPGIYICKVAAHNKMGEKEGTLVKKIVVKH
jgi:hypothetical protein